MRAIALALSLLCALAGPAVGQGAADPLALSGETLGSIEEREARLSIDTGKVTRAREQAEKILRTEPDSAIATYVLGRVHFEAEGNLARALYLIRKSRRLLEEVYGEWPSEPAAERLHREMISAEAMTLAQMDRREEQLAVYDLFDTHYYPKRTALRIWPLLKLGRFEEARAIGERLLHDDDPDIRERAYNGLMAVEEEAGNRKASYTWGIKALEVLGDDSCIIATNTALGARRAFDFPKTITYDQTALKAADRTCPTSPHAQLAAMHLVFGAYQQSLSALEALRAVPRPPDLRVQNETVIRARFVELLLALGQFDEAEPRVREILAQPDRAGMISASSEIVELSNALLGYAVFTARMHQLEERAAVRPLMAGLSVRYEGETIAAARWRTARDAKRLAALPELLHKHVRPYYTDVMPWYGLDMLDIFGAGVMRQAVEEVRAIETDYPEAAGAFLDAYLAELAWREGDYQDAIRRGDDVLARLPDDPKLLRHRIRAWLADARRRTGDQAGARRDFAAVLDAYPTALRVLDLELPVDIDSIRGPRGDELADRLDDSPRFTHERGAPFGVDIDDGGEQITICLVAGKRRCATLEGDDYEAADDPLAEALDRFHDTVLSPAVELTQSDINSLDGRAVQQDARQALDRLLGPRKSKTDDEEAK